MCFKGTNKINGPKELFSSFDKIGAVFNAFTEKDHTCFYVQCGDEYNEHCLNSLSDMVLNSVFKKKEYDMETPIVLEEMIRSLDDPDTNLFNEVDRFLYNGSPYSEPVDDIEYHHAKHPYKYDATVNYYKHYYQPQNIVVSVVSNDSFVKIKQIFTKTFFAKTKNKKISTQIPIFKNPVINRNNANNATNANTTYKILEKKGMKSQHLCIAFRTCPHDNADRFALNILSQIVGGSMSSRMRMLLREENGLTYESECSTDYNRVGGEFAIYAVLDPTKLIHNGKKKGVLPLLLTLVTELLANGITKTELEVAKGNYKGKLLLQQKNISNTAEYNGVQCTIYENEPFVPYREHYDTFYRNLTVKEVNNVIQKYFTHANMHVSIIGEHSSQLTSLAFYLKKIHL
jgi:predicted Zn-dependent peptidase